MFRFDISPEDPLPEPPRFGCIGILLIGLLIMGVLTLLTGCTTTVPDPFAAGPDGTTVYFENHNWAQATLLVDDYTVGALQTSQSRVFPIPREYVATDHRACFGVRLLGEGRRPYQLGCLNMGPGDRAQVIVESTVRMSWMGLVR